MPCGDCLEGCRRIRVHEHLTPKSTEDSEVVNRERERPYLQTEKGEEERRKIVAGILLPKIGSHRIAQDPVTPFSRFELLQGMFFEKFFGLDEHLRGLGRLADFFHFFGRDQGRFVPPSIPNKG